MRRVLPGILLFAVLSGTAARAAPEPTAQDGVTVTAAPGKGFTVRSGDDYSLTLRPRIQLRDTLQMTPASFPDDGSVSNEAQVKTLRLLATGNVVVKELTWGLQLAFGPGDYEAGNPSPIFDAWAEVAFAPAARVRVGQFFVPFDRARTIREFALQFVDRQQVVKELSLDRDVGVMLAGPDLFDGWLGYALFVGTGEGKNPTLNTSSKNARGPASPSPLVVARVFSRPFGSFDDDVEGDLKSGHRPRLAIGVAAAFNKDSSRALSTSGAHYAAGVADTAHADVDVVFKFAGFSLLAEALVRQALVDEVSGPIDDDGVGDVDGKTVTTKTRSAAGGFVQAGWMITPFVEVVGRYEILEPLGDTDPALVAYAGAQGQQLGAGTNLYLNGHALKLQLDTLASFGRDGVHRQIAHAQLDASF